MRSLGYSIARPGSGQYGAPADAASAPTFKNGATRRPQNHAAAAAPRPS